MTDGEARTWLGLGDTAAGPEDVRIAYLELRRRITLDSDPAVFIASRQAFETLRGTGAAQAQDDLLAARARLAEAPDSADARWTLLSQLGYSDGTEAFGVLRDGAERQPDEFADELLFHFAAKAPAAVLARARARALAPRMLVIADVHASQGRPAEAHLDVGALPPGAYRLTGKATIDGRVVTEEQTFVVRAGGPELDDVAARDRVLRELAQVSGGSYSFEELKNVAVRPSREVRVGRQQSVEIWSTPLLLVAALALLAAEWTLRRRAGHS
jgi:hypothetical protein